MLQGARGRKGPRLLARALQAPSLALRGCANPDPIPGKAVGTETRPLCCSLPAEARWGFSLPTAAGWSRAVCRKHLLEGTKSWAGTCSGSTHTSPRGCSSNAPHPRGGFKSSAPSPPRPRALVLSEWLLPSFSSSERGCQPPWVLGGGVLGCSIPFQHGEVRRDGEGAGFVRCGGRGALLAQVPVLGRGRGGRFGICWACVSPGSPLDRLEMWHKRKKTAAPMSGPAHGVLCTAPSSEQPTSSLRGGEMSHCERRNGGEGGKKNKETALPRGTRGS